MLSACRRGLVFAGGVSLAACSGVQTGDQGDDQDGCQYLPPVEAAFDTVPEGMTETAAELLAPAFMIEGSVQSDDGATHPLTLTLALDEDTLVVNHLDDARSTDCVYREPELRIDGTGTVSGDGWIEGKVGAQIRAGGTKIWVYLDTSELERKPETQLGTEAVLAMGLYLGTDCRWSGQWNYHSLNSAECEAEPCDGIEVDELGEFSAEGSCD